MEQLTLQDAVRGTSRLDIPRPGATLRDVLNHNGYQYNENTMFYLNDDAVGQTAVRLNDVARVGGRYSCMAPTKAGR